MLNFILLNLKYKKHLTVNKFTSVLFFKKKHKYSPVLSYNFKNNFKKKKIKFNYNLLRLQLIQKNTRKCTIYLYNKYNSTLRSWSHKKLYNIHLKKMILFMIFWCNKIKPDTKLILHFTTNNCCYWINFIKILKPDLTQLSDILFQNNNYVIFNKPNFFFINFQKKKIKAIKKSRKKILYLMLITKLKKLKNILMFNLTESFYAIISSFILVFIFWVISLLELSLNVNSYNKTKLDVYECGFKTINKNIFPVSFNTITLIFFVIIYEIEFITLIPLLISLNLTTTSYTILLLYLIIVIVVTLYIDILLKKINWFY